METVFGLLVLGAVAYFIYTRVKAARSKPKASSGPDRNLPPSRER